MSTDEQAPFAPPVTPSQPGGPQPGSTPGPQPAPQAGPPAVSPGQPHVLVVPDPYAAVPPMPEVEPSSLGDRLRGALSSSGGKSTPFYPRVLRLRHVRPNGWQRALLVEGMLLLGTLVALADLATAWAPLILVVATAVVVKFNDVLAGLLPDRRTSAAPEHGPPGGL
jgi:hypothetical protein